MRRLSTALACLALAILSSKAETIVDLKKAIIFPKAEMKNISLVEAVDYLRLRTRELAPHGTNLNMVIIAGDKALAKTRINKLSFDNTPLDKALDQVCAGCNFRYVEDTNAIVFLPQKAKRTSPITKDDKGEGSKQLDNIVLGLTSFGNTSMEEAVEFLNLRVKGIKPQAKLKLIVQPAKEGQSPRIPDLNLRNATLRDILSYSCELTGSTYSVTGNKVIITTP